MDKDRAHELNVKVDGLKMRVGAISDDFRALNIQLIEKKIEYLTTHIDIILRALGNLITILITGFISTFAFSGNTALQLDTLRSLLAVSTIFFSILILVFWTMRHNIIEDSFNRISKITHESLLEKVKPLEIELEVMHKELIGVIKDVLNTPRE